MTIVKFVKSTTTKPISFSDWEYHSVVINIHIQEWLLVTTYMLDLASLCYRLILVHDQVIFLISNSWSNHDIHNNGGRTSSDEPPTNVGCLNSDHSIMFNLPILVFHSHGRTFGGKRLCVENLYLFGKFLYNKFSLWII